MNQRKHLKNLKHLVLTGPEGEQPGRPDHKDIALQFLAIKKTRAGFGGGIVNLLIPKTTKQWKTVEKLRSRGYFYKAVNARPSIREEVRNAAVNDGLITELAYLFVIENQNSRRAMSAPVREFAVWIVKKIGERDPNIVQLFRSQPELLNRLSVDWWKLRISCVRKRKK